MTLDLHGLFRPRTLALSSRATKKEGDPFALEQVVESKTNQRNEEKEGDPLPSSRRSRKRTNNENQRRQATNAHEIVCLRISAPANIATAMTSSLRR
mmetsp:Transcript_33529/g.75352  ORF Transcript_33529/g.75352 Transcript_33529/m.75352 type:complete len:97 (-) Transcript_33529:1218-1508(-)